MGSDVRKSSRRKYFVFFSRDTEIWQKILININQDSVQTPTMIHPYIRAIYNDVVLIAMKAKYTTQKQHDAGVSNKTKLCVAYVYQRKCVVLSMRYAKRCIPNH